MQMCELKATGSKTIELLFPANKSTVIEHKWFNLFLWPVALLYIIVATSNISQ